MYQGLEPLLSPASYNRDRDNAMQCQYDAIDIANSELESFTPNNFARHYFGEDEYWLQKKVYGCLHHKKDMAFSQEEIATYIAALRDVAKRINTLADEIEGQPFDAE